MNNMEWNSPKSSPAVEIEPTYLQDELLLKNMTKAETFDPKDTTIVSLMGTFDYIKGMTISFAEEYPTTDEKAKESIKRFVLRSLALFKEKAQDYAEYSRRNMAEKSYLKPEMVADTYYFLYSIAAKEGIVTDKEEMQRVLDEIKDDQRHTSARITLQRVLAS